MLATPEYKPLADQARIGAAESQEAFAYAALKAIQDDDAPGAVTRQVRLSELHMKSAATRDPRSYGPKVQHDIEASGAITIKVMHFTQQEAPLTIDCSNSEQVALVDNSLDVKLPTE